jgi:hypothetical protein
MNCRMIMNRRMNCRMIMNRRMNCRMIMNRRMNCRYELITRYWQHRYLDLNRSYYLRDPLDSYSIGDAVPNDRILIAWYI